MKVIIIKKKQLKKKRKKNDTNAGKREQFVRKKRGAVFINKKLPATPRIQVQKKQTVQFSEIKGDKDLLPIKKNPFPPPPTQSQKSNEPTQLHKNKNEPVQPQKNNEPVQPQQNNEPVQPPKNNESTQPQQNNESPKKRIIEVAPFLYVYTDIIKPRCIGDIQSRYLRVIPMPSDERHIRFTHVEYCALEKIYIENISILITDSQGDRINFNASSSPTYIMLHFKKMD